jgi:hypothetical protein
MNEKSWHFHLKESIEYLLLIGLDLQEILKEDFFWSEGKWYWKKLDFSKMKEEGKYKRHFLHKLKICSTFTPLVWFSIYII